MLNTDDHIALQNLIWLYTHILDEHRYSRTSDVFTAEAVFDATAVGGPRAVGIPAMVDFWRESARHMPALLHHASNIVIEEQPDGSARISSRALVILPPSNAVIIATYEDVACRTGDGWRIRERLLEVRGPDFVATES